MELSTAISLLQNNLFPRLNISSWADLGCGEGLFTEALGQLLIAGSKIYAADNDGYSLNKVPEVQNIIIERLGLDFIKEDLPFNNLDGILMANSLHFVEHKPIFIHRAEKHLKSDGAFLIVEYDMDTPNPWVPFPVSFQTLKEIFKVAGYTYVEKLNESPSAYNRANIYSALVQH